MSQKEPPLLDPEELIRLIQPNSPLSTVFKGFESREAQQKMMRSIIQALNHNEIALIEAGTGTGKSIAYLLPAFFWAMKTQQRALISTHTIALQEQLINKDIPLLLKALKLPIKAILLKGMSHYLCLKKIHDCKEEPSLFTTQESSDLEKINDWTRSMKTGARSDFPFRISSQTWEKVGAETETCTYNRCPFYKQCFYFKVREQAEEANILIVNHSLLLADLTRRHRLNNYKDTTILPSYHKIVLDEAHHIEDIATEFLANRLNKTDLFRTLNKLTSEKQGIALGKLSLLNQQIQSQFKTDIPQELMKATQQLSFDLSASKRGIQEQSNYAFDLFGDFFDILNSSYVSTTTEKKEKENKLRLLPKHFSHPHWQSTILPQTESLLTLLKGYIYDLYNLENKLSLFENSKFQELTQSTRNDIKLLLIKLEEQMNGLKKFIDPKIDPNRVRWIEESHSNKSAGVQIVETQLDISKLLVEILFSKFSSIIMCSATLTANSGFQFIRKRLGIVQELLAEKEVTENIYPSPFNYSQQALLVIPHDIPDPQHSDYFAVVNERILEAIQAAQGQAFVLFTSYIMLEKSCIALRDKLHEGHYPLFKQGDSPRHLLLQQFVQTKRSVLFGTSSFWEGVDVPGEALRCVIMVKLPFKVPSEPIIAARSEVIEQQGGNAFMEYSVPNAIMMFKQGSGRLIRNRWDRGCIVCLDTRVIKKPYGHLFLDSLPPCSKFFGSSKEVKEKMVEFYKMTYHLVKKSPFQNNNPK